MADGRAVLPDFPVNFDVHDVDHSGVVEALDSALVSAPGDFDDDADVDLRDFATFQVEATGSDVPYLFWECGVADLDTDGDVDAEDMVRLIAHWSGPNIMAE